jgi:hypothetical protein
MVRAGDRRWVGVLQEDVDAAITGQPPADQDQENEEQEPPPGPATTHGPLISLRMATSTALCAMLRYAST